MPDHVKILLSEAASAALLAAGDAWMIAGRAAYPEDGKRVVIHLLPIPKSQADAACRVAMGEARAVRIAKKADPEKEP